MIQKSAYPWQYGWFSFAKVDILYHLFQHKNVKNVVFSKRLIYERETLSHADKEWISSSEEEEVLEMEQPHDIPE